MWRIPILGLRKGRIMSKPKVISVDFKTLRAQRQGKNNELVYQSILTNNSVDFTTSINKSELQRTLEHCGLSINEFLEQCRVSNLTMILASRLLAKSSSRQGTFDELEQINITKKIGSHCGININKLSQSAIRPVKDGRIITSKEQKELCIKKDMCLKSFDAQISGNLNGFISAKVSFSGGGHQDNVFEEMDSLADWWKHYKKNSEDILVLLIDTDLEAKFDSIKVKYADIKNIHVFNHIHFQEYMLEHYWSSN